MAEEKNEPIDLHLTDLNTIGGLTMPKSNSHWKSLPTTKVKVNKNQPQVKNMVEKYTKKPVVIEAIQYKGYMTDDVKNFIGDSLISESRWGDEGGPVGYFIKTLEGTSYMLDKKDWIIKGVKSEFYPCKPDVFEMTYEKLK